MVREQIRIKKTKPKEGNARACLNDTWIKNKDLFKTALSM